MAGTSEQDAYDMQVQMGTRCPIHLGAIEVSWAARNRVWWLSWKLKKRPAEVWETGKKGPQLTKWGAKPQAEQTFNEGWQPGSNDVSCLTRPQRPRQGHTSRLNGIEKADKYTLQRWQKDGNKYAPYRYEAKHVIWDPEGNSRMPNVGEMEKLMGFPQDYTKDEQNKNTTLQREQLLGNSMHTDVLSRILQDAPFRNQPGGSETETGPSNRAPSEEDNPNGIITLEGMSRHFDLRAQEAVEQTEVDEVNWQQEADMVKANFTGKAPNYNAQHEPKEETQQSRDRWPKEQINRLKEGATKAGAAGDALRLIDVLWDKKRREPKQKWKSQKQKVEEHPPKGG